MIEDYGLWTVAPNQAAVASTRTLVESARRVGLYKEIHIWSHGTEDIGDARIHPLRDFDPRGGFYRLDLLSETATFTRSEHLVWLDPATSFSEHPGSVLHTLRGAPIHVPLTFDLMTPQNREREWLGISCPTLGSVMKKAGVANSSIFAAENSFFVVHRAVILTVQELASSFRQICWNEGMNVPVTVLLAYTMQMLCGDARRHVVQTPMRDS